MSQLHNLFLWLNINAGPIFREIPLWMFSLINCQIRAEPMRQSLKKHNLTWRLGENRAARGLLGRFHHRARPPSAAGGGRRRRERGGDRLFFTVRDLIARRFHYLCTNVTFSSDQGARQPPAARLASCQAIVQKLRSQSGLPGADRGEERDRKTSVRQRY